MKKIVILQSNYIPWKGYFDLMASADEFILYDTVQYTKRDWRNRNQIKTPLGLQWLTIPTITKGKYYQNICDVEVCSKDWGEKHWKSISLNYQRSPHFKEISELISPLYLQQNTMNLSKINLMFLKKISAYLKIKTKISLSSDFDICLDLDKTERLVNLCQQANATTYISGPAAKSYINPQNFRNANIDLVWFNYPTYPTYPQNWGSFTHHVSIIDLLFNCGSNSMDYIKHEK